MQRLATTPMPIVATDNFNKELTPQLTDAIFHISTGQTGPQIARHLKIENDDVTEIKHRLGRIFRTPSLPAVVSLAINSEFIPIEIAAEENILKQLNNTDYFILRHLASGGTSGQLCRLANRNNKTINAYIEALLPKVGAWNRPHAVRRGYELGILPLSKTISVN